MTDDLLRGIYDSQDAIPETVTIENARELFTERDGKWELTQIPDLAPATSISRLETAKAHESTAHNATKVKLQELLDSWGDLKPEEVRAKLDRIPELEAAAEGKLDDAKIQELAERRAAVKVQSILAPKEREFAKVARQRDELLSQVEKFQTADRERRIGDATRIAARAARVLDTAEEDALFLAQSHLEVREDDGAIVTREGLMLGGKSIPAGLDAAAWLAEIQESRPHWWPESRGAGAKGSSGGAKGGPNPFKPESWNATEQGRIARERGQESANRLAAAAGIKPGETLKAAQRVARQRQSAHGAR
jgi:hypothetical protein